jgi:hypothetical protein
MSAPRLIANIAKFDPPELNLDYISSELSSGTVNPELNLDYIPESNPRYFRQNGYIDNPLVLETPGVKFDLQFSITECPICTDIPTADPRILTCGHVFCGYCITVWVSQYNSTCPCCRVKV